MASGRYSFIDIAVLDKVRERFAAGDALALLSIDLNEIIWANGPGAALFGHADVESVMGASPGLGFVARRQIAAVPGFPRMERDRAVTVRLARGATSRAMAFDVGAATLPDGVPAVLVALPAAGTGRPAGDIVAGFEEAGYFAALIDGDGAVLAGSDSFPDLGIAPETLAALVAEVARESDRLVKRLVPAGDRVIPAGIARLTDSPALHLLIGVDEPVETSLAETSPDAARPENEAAQIDAPAMRPAPSDADLPERVGENGGPSSAGAPDGEAKAPSRPAAGDSDDWYFDNSGASSPSPEAREEARPSLPLTRPNLAAGPVRFAWRTDARGAFSAVSPEFAAAVGSQAADIIGRPFREVAARFGLDPDDEIASLLDRRDTWSGRTVLWPVAGTDLVAPVDLAALPVYNRDRVFEGFRGFGVTRMDDARPDPQARGLHLADDEAEETPAAAPAETPADTEEEPDDTPHEVDPFRSEVPVISISERLNRRVSDKIIRLAEHRPPQPEPQPAARQLSPGERNAFEEIRERLRRETAAAAEEAEQTKETQAGDETAEAHTPQAGDEAPQPPQVEEDASPAADDFAPPITADASQDDALPEPVAEDDDNLDTEATAESEEDDETVAAEPDAWTGQDADDEDDAGLPSTFGAERRPSVDPELIAGLPLPLLVHAGDELYFANREFLALTGYSSLDQIRKEGGLDRLFVEDETPAEAGGRKLRLRTLGGETFPVDAHLQSIGWEDGTALLLALNRADLAAPQAPSAAPAAADDEVRVLERHLAELRTIIDTATDGVVLIAPDGTIRNISRPAEALFGFDSARVEGKPFATLFAIESQKSARDYLAGLADNGVASVLNDGREVIGREAEGRFIPLFMTIGRLPEDSGYCAVVRDITQFKRAEEELTQARAQAERASSQKTEFLARVSHEIRTPLNAIIGFSELMIDEKFGPIGPDRYRDYLRDINRSGNHVLDLVNDLLDISKIEAGEQEMNYEAVSLNEALSEAIAMMQPQANRERVIIRSSLASRLPDVVADLRSVRQIALNLLSNAIRYTQAGGQVIVSTAYEPSGDVTVRVRDTGIGMTLAEIDQALKPFKQINALKRGRNDGTGLGLPLTKAMVEANRARFAINSTPGEGTLVEIVFPSTRVLAE
ncbi:MAG: PAS domain S-box protein [Aquamicrobium sp.]|uniref:histidine kinase dimerization/phospho-acceptor domain-containing protein n=1 Tax=Aquamicrobium sp. TaxID=1872579 RepID=UPI00349EB5F5|nr:PAS domain S-box protein [Aquamicrobium sp.]